MCITVSRTVVRTAEKRTAVAGRMNKKKNYKYTKMYCTATATQYVVQIENSWLSGSEAVAAVRVQYQQLVRAEDDNVIVKIPIRIRQ